MKKLFTFNAILLTALLLFSFANLNSQSRKVPGIVVDYIPASTKTYIGSPSICIMPNGEYIASHDHFGPESTEHEKALTAVFRSSDKGKSRKRYLR